jgi:uncharacterized protein (TIGR03435 family)
MFERYTEKARRSIFFARYEANQFGSPYVETEYLLLGLLREDSALANRFLHSRAAVESMRKQIKGHMASREKTSTSVDLPLSPECKRVLAYGAEESERRNHKHIGINHLLLGLLREEECFAAQLLRERGLTLDLVRDLAQQSEAPVAPGVTMPELSDHRPKFPPSHLLHVSPSRPESDGGNYSGPDFRNWLGYRLTTFVAEMYETSPARIDLPAGLDDGRRYDFAMVLPKPVPPQEMSRLMQQGIQDHYHLATTREIRLLDVYVMTVPTGTPPVIKPRLDDGNLGFSCSFSSSFYSVRRRGDPEPESTLDRPIPLSTVGSASMSNATLDDFCRFLERNLDRPLINETNLMGNFDLQVTGEKPMSADFIERLRDQLGLFITALQRPVEMLIFRK